MKTKVSSDNNGEGVPPQTTVVTTTVGQSSVWSICDISTDSHVELRDITPSISPVFTDDQVHELTQNSSEVDVLGEHFLPPEAIKQIDEVLSSQAQGNLLYSDPVLGNALKQNHDVLLPGDLGFHGTMFPSFDSIVEADRILNKRDESADAISSEGNDTAADQTSSAAWSKDGTAVSTPGGESGTDGGDSSGTEKGPRRSMRKRVQVKKDSETLKTALPASKPVSRGKDISKLKYANNKEEAPKKEVRRSGRMQKKGDKGENSADTEEKESNVNSTKKDITIDKEADKESLEQQDSTSQNVRRSPRTQKKSPVEEKKNRSRKQDDKKEANTSSDGKESCEEKASDKESKSKGTKSRGSEKTNKKGTSDGDVTGSDKDEKKGVRKSGRTARQKKEEEETKMDNENNKEDAKKGKGKTEGKKIEEAKNKEDSEIKVTEKNLSENDESKKGSNKSVADEKPEKSENPRTQGKEEDGKTKAIGRKKVELNTESSEEESVVKTRRVSRRNERLERKDTEENIAGKSSKEEAKSVASLKKNAIEEQDTIKQEDKADKEGSDEKENIKKEVQGEVTTSAVKDEKASKESKKVGKKVSSGDVEESKEEEDGDSDENSVDDNEEVNEDSDYDPEYDPDRLWCVCRKPHGNRFMICCDHCEDWFHGMCVGITMAQGRQMEKDGQEYVCPKCQAKVEEEMKEKNKETKPKTENVAKEKEETYKHSEAKEGRKSPTKHGHHKRKEHSVKIKIPFEKDDTRKRRHSSHRRSQDDELSGSKKSKEPDREHTSEEKKKKQPESKGFRIPKKVRTTPTPASYIHHPTRKMCITAGCSMFAEHHSLYCSPDCVQKHAEESLKIILDERKKRMGYKQPVSSSKNIVSPTSSLLGPVPWDHNPAPNSSQSESAPKEGIAVIERSTGRVIAGVAAPTQEELLYWLQDHPTFEVLRPAGAKDDKKKEKKEDSEKSIRDNIRKSLKDILTLRSKEQQDLSVSEEKIIKCSLDVEGEMFSFFGDTGHRYKNKYRSLMFNLKDPRNKVLFRHVLLGEITVDRLVRMTPEQLASPELATWREQETKHTLEMIKQNQEEINATKAHTKKTHKGEVEIDDDDLSTLENSVKANAELKEEQKLPDSNTGSSTLLLDTTDEHRMHLFDLNCRICTGKMLPPGEPPRRETPSPLVSTTSIVQAVAESSIPSPTPMDIVTSANSPDSATVSQPPVSPSVLNKNTKKVPAVWKGFVMMQSVAKFGTSAYRVSGSCEDLLQLLPDTLHIQGRIAHEQVWDYLLQLKSSTSREVCVIRYEASSDDEKLSYVSLYSYFYSRKRCGVVSNCYTGVKDMYLVPLASHQPIPPELLPFDGPGLDEPRPHMLLGVIVRSKAVFKRPRALSQRSMSPPPKRRTSSASIETNSSDGGVSDSPASKRDTLRELRDSPPADIDDIVFQYHTSQAKKTAGESKDSSFKASPASESSTPSVSSSTGISSAVSSEKSSLPSLEAQKQQLLDLQERARQYILAQTQKKTASSAGKQGVENEQSGSSEVVSVDQQAGVAGTADDDAPYDPEEGLDLDLTDITPSKLAVTTKPVDPVKPVELAKPVEPAMSVNTATPVDSAKPSSLEILVSTLQRLQGTAPQLSAASAFLPKASSSILQPMNPAAREHQSSASSDIVSHSSATSGHGQAKSEELSRPHFPVATADRLHSSSVSSAQRPQFSPSSDHRLHPGLQPGPSSNQRLHPALSSDQRPQPRNASDQRLQPGPTDHRPQPGPTVDQRLHPAPSSDQRPQPRQPSDQRVQPGPTDHRPQPGPIVDQRLQHRNSSDQRAPFGPSTDQRTQPHPDRWNPSEPPQVTRQVNNVTQDVEQYSGLRPEERARLAARESRLGSRENRRVSSDHRDPHYDQRRIDDRHRPGWHNDSRYHRDSRDSRDDSRRNWRDDYRQGRPWYSDEQRRDRHDHPPRHEDRREERRFKEHWNRDRWRR